MRPIAATILAIVLTVEAFGWQANSSTVALAIQKISPNNVGYDVAIKIVNEGAQPAIIALSGTTRPKLHALGVQQWDGKGKWLSVGPCRDVPADTTRSLPAGESLEDVVPIGDANHGWSSTICPSKVEHLGGKIRAVLCVYASDEQFRKHVPCKQVASEIFELPKPIHIGTLEKRPTKLVQPVYPEKAKNSRIQGTVVLSIVIGEDGSVTDVKVVKGSSMLADSAVVAVRQWHYEPYLLNGSPVSAEGKITINFVLPKAVSQDSSSAGKNSESSSTIRSPPMHLPDLSLLSTMTVYPLRWEFRDIYDSFSCS